MKWILSLTEAKTCGTQEVGGKARALADLTAAGFPVPRALCLTVAAYGRFVRQTGLRQRIAMELGRKDPGELRWEELWDASLRIRNLFLTTPWPPVMERRFQQEVEAYFGPKAFVVRSSAPCEDSAAASFAGLHESIVNVRGTSALLDAVRKVWASLWSDRALLYRQELKLNVHGSAMAVLIQELACGEKSGVAFSQSPTKPGTLVIESVWGLNQGLVDGDIEPDHWELQRDDLTALRHRPAQREKLLQPIGGQVAAAPLDKWQMATAPLNAQEVRQVATLALHLEDFFGNPQDVEWTWQGKHLWLLQSRPVTARQNAGNDDQRGWYLSLHRSMENLQNLRRRLEQEILPGMEAAAAGLSCIPPESLSDNQLAEEIIRRRGILAEWEEVYRTECIPMAHGVRLFGEFYTDTLHPADPFEFVHLLENAGMRAVQRNRRWLELAMAIKTDSEIQTDFSKDAKLTEPLQQRLEELAEETGLEKNVLREMLHRMAQTTGFTPAAREPQNSKHLEKEYLARFPQEDRARAAEYLDLGRASYRLRDDDNLSLDRIRRQVAAAEGEGRRRLALAATSELQALLNPEKTKAGNGRQSGTHWLSSTMEIRVRQLQGQPAGPGVVTAAARVIHEPSDLVSFQSGEVLVCDAIDPAMTFIVPLASGIVERRGGMLIHGAIIAREYGLPCVTGIANATDIIQTGERVTVDGYLGLIVIHRD